MKKIKLLSIVAASLLTVGAVAACGPTTDDKPTITIGLHNNLGAGAGYAAVNQGYFEAEGINIKYEVGGGPALATKLVAGDIQLSFMGGGVAWNYFTSKEEIKIAALDNLTDDDRLIASTTGKGKDLTANSTLVEVAQALRGAKIAVDYTTNPYTWFHGTLLANMNKELPEGQRIWFENDKGDKMPAGLSEKDYVEANECTLVNTQNANIPNTMAGGGYDFAVAFAPVATTLEKQTDKYKTVVRTSTHFADFYAPSTWGVNTKWMNENKDIFHKAMRALAKGMTYRRDHATETTKIIEEMNSGAVKAESLSTDIAIWLGADDQVKLYEDGRMKDYAQNILNANLGNDKVDPTMTVERSTVFADFVAACKEVA